MASNWLSLEDLSKQLADLNNQVVDLKGLIDALYQHTPMTYTWIPSQETLLIKQMNGAILTVHMEPFTGGHASGV